MDNPDFITCDGDKIAFYQYGSGPAMVLLHGITTWSFIWENMIPRLAEHFTVYAFDLLGCGHSDKPLNKDLSLSGHAKRLLTVFNQLGLTEIHLVGHDLGGGIAQLMTVQHPHLIKSLILMNSVAFDYWPVQPIVAIRTPVIKYLLMAIMDAGALKLIVKRGLHNRGIADGPVLEKFNQPFSEPNGKKSFLRFAKSLDNSELTAIEDQLKTLTIPTLIIRGHEDVYLDAAIAEKLHQVIPHSQLIIIEKAGHFIQLDTPGELTDQILRFTGQG